MAHYEIKNLSFSYPAAKGKESLKNVSLTIQKGEYVVLCGKSGSGKTTLLRHLKPVLAPHGRKTGTILFDGIPMEQLSREVLNASIATVSQNITLFSGSVRDNLTLWNHAILEEDMIAAAKDACIHDFIIQQPGGYDYMLTVAKTVNDGTVIYL